MKHFFKPSCPNRIPIYYIAAAVLFFSVAVLSLCLGSTSLSLFEVFSSFFRGQTTSTACRIFLYVRLPRTLSALICGGALALSGALAQGTLHNRLASPSILGVNAGAGLAVTLATAFGILGGFLTSLFAFLGAVLASALIALFSRRFGLSRANVILCGVALNALFNAITSAVITLIPDVGVMSNDFRIGDFSSVTYRTLLPASLVIVISAVLAFTLSNDLDALALGDERAMGLGISPHKMRLIFMLLIALLSGASVSLSGLLSFVGLIVPHVVRMLGVYKSKHLLPLSALFGASFVTLCDTMARTLFSPYEVPVGILMAIFGSPFFLFLLFSRKGEHYDRM